MHKPEYAFIFQNDNLIQMSQSESSQENPNFHLNLDEIEVSIWEKIGQQNDEFKNRANSLLKDLEILQLNIGYVKHLLMVIETTKQSKTVIKMNLLINAVQTGELNKIIGDDKSLKPEYIFSTEKLIGGLKE